MSTCQKWMDTNILWKNSNWLWSECQLALELEEKFRYGIDPVEFNKEETFWIKDLDKKTRLIKLVCKIKNETFDESKEVKNIKIKIEDVKLVVKSVLNIELNVKG